MRVLRVLMAFGVLISVAGCTSGDAAEDVVLPTSTAVETTIATVVTTTAPVATTTSEAEEAGHPTPGVPVDHVGVAAANLATAAFQDVAMAEAAGYASTIDALGCFEDAEAGGMGLHYLNETLMDANLDVTTPEALVYELDAGGEITGLVAHEYIVPVEAWTDAQPPTLFDTSLHQHPVLPLWVLHAWIWKDNPAGMFQDWNPAVRLCPEGVPVFGVDLP